MIHVLDTTILVYLIRSQPPAIAESSIWTRTEQACGANTPRR